MIKAVIFDLDDTLYPEKEFVMSGFMSVAKYLHKKYNFSFNDIFNVLKIDFDNGIRGNNFNLLIEKKQLPKNEIDNLIYIYRTHYPEIKLYQDAKEILFQLKNKYKIGIITDGFVHTQKNKIKALNLDKIVDEIIYTDEYGKEKWKPNPFGFNLILEKLKIKPKEALFIGDNPIKDFLGAKAIGIHTVRIYRKDGEYSNKVVDKNYSAEYEIDNLTKVCEIIYKINTK